MKDRGTVLLDQDYHTCKNQPAGHLQFQDTLERLAMEDSTLFICTLSEWMSDIYKLHGHGTLFFVNFKFTKLLPSFIKNISIIYFCVD